MARDLRLQIDGDSKGARRALDDVADESDKAAVTLRALGREMKQAAREGGHLEGQLKDVGGTAKLAANAVDALGRDSAKAAAEMSTAAKAADRLDGQLGGLRREIQKLQKAYGETGDAKILTELEKQYSAHDKILKVKKRIAKEDEDERKRAKALAEDAKREVERLAAVAKRDSRGVLRNALGDLLGIGKSAVGGAWSAGSSALGLGTSAAEGGLSTPVLGPALALAGASAAGLAAFPLGGAIGGATLAGLGGGVAAGGLAGAWMAHPEKYQPKWDALVDHVTKRWIDSSQAYGDELDNVLKIAAQTADRLPLEKLLAESQSFVRPLAEGTGNGIANFANGLADALAKAQPVVDTLGPKLGELGHAAGDALRAISMGSEGGAHALGDLVDGLGYLIRATGIAIAGLENGYEKMRNFAIGAHNIGTSLPVVGSAINKFSDIFWHIGGSTITVGHALDKGAASSHKFGSALVGAAKDAAAAELAALGLNDALIQTRDTMLGMVDANIAYAQGWLDLNKELKEGTKTLDLNTQAGIDNQKAIVNQIQLAEQQREQTIANSDHTQAAIDAANKKYYEQVEAIRKAAIAAGFNKDQVDALIRSLGAVPPDTQANVSVNGAGKALSIIDDLRFNLGKFAQTYTAHLQVEGASGLRSGPERHAVGGTVRNTGMSLVGERGPELAWLSRGQYVSTAEETRKLMSMAGGSSGGGTGTAPVAIHVAAGADQAAGRLVQYLIDRGYIQAFAGGKLLTTRRS